MRARHYDAGVARFITEDPAGFIDGPNLYAYVGGNPIMLVDPTGLSDEGGAQQNNKVGVGDFVELLGKSAAENIKAGTTLEAAFGPGAGAESAFNLNGDTDLTFTYIKGLKLKAGFHISGQALSKGNIQGFSQGVQFFLFGCVGVNWDYGGNWNINASLTFPISVGGGVVSNYTNTGSNIVNSLQGGN